MADGLYYNGYYSALYQGNINLIGGNVYLALLTSSYVPDLTNHTDWSQALNYEVAGTGYTAGGQVLTSPVLTIDAVNKRMQFKASNVVWASSAITARYGIVYLKNWQSEHKSTNKVARLWL